MKRNAGKDRPEKSGEVRKKAHGAKSDAVRDQAIDAAENARCAVQGVEFNAVVALKYSHELYAKLDVGEMAAALEGTCEAVSRGELRPLETLLASQAVALNAIFTQFSMLARVNLTKANLDASERLLRLAFRAQNQCRATLETVAMIQNPPVFARQANIANGPQQVNNTAVIPISDGSRVRAGKLEPGPIELLEAAKHVERMDGGATSAAGAGDSRMAPLAGVNRPKND